MTAGLAGLPHGRRVDQRHRILDVLRHHVEEQRLVAVLQVQQEQVAVEVAGARPRVGQRALLLLLDGVDARWQQPLQPQRFALGGREGGMPGRAGLAAFRTEGL